MSLKDYRGSLVFTLVALAIALWWKGPTGVILALILSIMEVSLSFDNAIVNAGVLRHMEPVWRQRFITWGMLIAVFGMRLVFPVLIVSVVAHLGFIDVVQMALQQPEEYARHLTESHVAISSFGGMFLLLVFLHFIMDAEKDTHWLGFIEKKFAAVGKLDMIQATTALFVLLVLQAYLPEHERVACLTAGVAGIATFMLIDGLTSLFPSPEPDEEGASVGQSVGDAAKHAGLMSFIYLEALDASFSFDGVIGAFAITKDVVTIMVGLAVGAMFVRSMTIALVRKGTLQQYIYLEHGAHYAIGVLAFLMFLGLIVHVPEVITGLLGVGFIVMALISSIAYNKRNPPGGPGSGQDAHASLHV